MAKVITTELLELQRKLNCSQKKDTRTIFFGPPVSFFY